MEQDSLHYARCLKILAQSPLFASVDEALLKDMLLIFHYKTRAKGETAISPEQALDRFHIIISGRARVSVYNPENGREHILFLIGPGDGFDLISLLDGEWHDAVATVLDDMEVLYTTVQQAREWLKISIRISIGLSCPIWGNRCTGWQIRLPTCLYMILRRDWRGLFSVTWCPTNCPREYPSLTICLRKP